MKKKLIWVLALALIALPVCKIWADTNAVYNRASEIDTDTSAFNNNLSSADNTAQKALDTLDNISIATSGLHYLTSTAESGLSAEVNLGALTSGMLKHTVSGGVSTPATATEGTDYYKPGGTKVSIGDGGTGQGTAAAGFDALSPMTALGDTIYGGASGTRTRLAGNITTTRKFLRQTGDGAASAAPAWDTVTSTDVGLGNVENTTLSTWAGSTNLTTLGTISTGTWSATTIAVNKGGTGQTSYTDGQLLIGNTTGNTLAKATLTGTSNQVVVTNGSGTITLSTPQSIGTASTPQFARIGLGAAADAVHLILAALGTVTVDTHAIDITGTWNSGGTTFTAIKANITSTASAAASLLMDLQIGSVTQFSVSKAGVVTALGGAVLGGATNKSTFDSSGILTYGGTAKPNRTIILSAGGAISPTSNGAAIGTIDGSNVSYKVLDFDSATQESAFWTFRLPDGWDAGTVTFTVEWQAAATTNNVIWGVQACSVADAEAVDATLGSAQEVTDAAKGTANQLNDATPSAVTISGAGAGELVHVKVYRKAADGSDTMSGDARLVCVKMEYAASAESD